MNEPVIAAPPSVSPRQGVHAWKVVAIALLAVVAATAITMDRARWRLRLVDARFVDHREKASGGGAAVYVTGYAIVRVESHRDIFRLSRDEDSYPQVRATLCDTGQPLGAWRDPLPLERDEPGRRFTYAVLIPAPSRDSDLASPGGICLHFVAAGASMAPWAQSHILTVMLPLDVREQMQAYVRRKGPVDLSLDPACAPQLCQPE